MTRIAPRLFHGIAAITITLTPFLGAGTALADAYPSKPIKLIVPFAAGGGNDVLARQIGKSMSDNLGQPIVIDNRGGAGGIIAAETAAKSAPDGYTLLWSTAGIHVVNPAIHTKLPYDPVKDWERVGQAVAAPVALVVLESSPYRTAQQLIEQAKKKPGSLSYGSAGNGSSLHQSGEMFKDAAGVDILHVAYKGGGPMTQDLLAGNIDMIFSYIGAVLPHVKTGKLRILTVGSSKRLSVIPDVPTVGEVVGKPEFDSDTWNGISAPAKTPQEAVRRLNEALTHALKENREKLLSSGYVPLGGTPEQMAQRVERELKTLTPLLRKVMGPTEGSR